ncbi:RCC1 domain-containing protein [Candidatus Palauibacter sp.]|uniref:RCC1 domain-containing protein n=1 Tax=Candidatus Palauibacter sp. TaxID=3101350 RepID=UPI003B01D2F7
MERTGPTGLSILPGVLLLLLVAACRSEIDPAGPSEPSAHHAAAAAPVLTTGSSIRVSPKAVAFFSRTGDPDRALEFEARVFDADGKPVGATAVNWAVAAGDAAGLRLTGASVSEDGHASVASVTSGSAGGGSLLASTGTLSDRATVRHWNWLEGELRGPNWGLPGQAHCLDVDLDAADTGGAPTRLEEFGELFVLSLNDGVAVVDSVSFSGADGAERVCMTGRSVGTSLIGVVAWDTASFSYVGQYADYHVLETPLTVTLPERWELGIGQTAPVSMLLRDNRGTTLPMQPEWLDSFGLGDRSVAEMRDGRLTGISAGSTTLSFDYVGQKVSRPVDVFAVVGWRYNGDVACVLLQRGSLRCWGDRNQPLWGYGQRLAGQVGPTMVGDLPLGGPAAELLGGFEWECARLTAGDVRCWGAGRGGLLGYGNRNPIGDNETPADAGPVPLGGGNVVDLGGGDDFTCAVFDSGRVRCWGSNHAGQLGLGHQRELIVGDNEVPAVTGHVALGGHAVQVVGGRFSACALLDTGKVRCWGYNGAEWDPATASASGANFGLGYGARDTSEPIGDDETPASMGDLPLPGTATRLAAGGYHACAIMEDGDVRCWGLNFYGALGHGQGAGTHIGDDESAAETIPLTFPSPAVDIVAGYWHNCVLTEAAKVWCWGRNETGPGQLGLPGWRRLGDNESALTAGPVDVGGPVARIFAFEDGTCAVLQAGGLRCWGYNGGILGYRFTDSIGSEESPASVGDIPLFRGAITGGGGGARGPPREARALDGVRSVAMAPGSRYPGSAPAVGAVRLGPLGGPRGVVFLDSMPAVSPRVTDLSRRVGQESPDGRP